MPNCVRLYKPGRRERRPSSSMPKRNKTAAGDVVRRTICHSSGNLPGFDELLYRRVCLHRNGFSSVSDFPEVAR
jgi:hypothetical protein